VIAYLKGSRFASLRRSFAVWLRRVVLTQVTRDTEVIQCEQLETMGNMLAETVKGWTEEWKVQGLAEGKAKGMAEGEARILRRPVAKGRLTMAEARLELQQMAEDGQITEAEQRLALRMLGR
jgi:hypothetical protein